VNDEIALFIDFENIRYSLINVQHREPDPQELIAQARRFGTVMVARAYADWSRQPEFFKGSLTAAMIDRVDCPAKVRERFRQNPSGPMMGQPYQPYAPQSAYGQGQLPAEGDMEAEEYDDEGEDEGNEQEIVDEMHADDDEPRAAEGDESDEGDEAAEGDPHEDGAAMDERRGQGQSGYYGNGGGYDRYGNGGGYGGYGNGGGYDRYGNGAGYYQGPPQPVITQSTVDLNMLMDIIETVFDRPSINTFILMTGDRDFTRISARLKLRLNKRVIVVGVPGTVSRDLISAAEQFIPLGFTSGPLHGNEYGAPRPQNQFVPAQGPVEPDEAGFIQFLDYIDKHWSWRTVGGVANFIGDPFNPKNRFRGRLTRDSARDLLRICIDEGILLVTTDPTGSENLRLNRQHPAVEAVLAINESALR
jgi:NYN domain-containing protein